MGLARAVLVLALGIGGVREEGVAARYAPGVMAKVARVRGIEPTECMVALTSAREITGRRHVLVTGRHAAQWCLVVDLPQDRDRPALDRRRIVVELDHESARVICGSTRDSPRMCPVTVFVAEE